MDTASDALEMELEEFHDFVKETHLETRTVNFTIMTNAFTKANSANSFEAFEQRKKQKRSAAVLIEQKAAETKAMIKKAQTSSGEGIGEGDRFTTEAVWGERFKAKKPDNRLTLVEFVGLLVRIAFLRANPKHGSYDNAQELDPLPGCLERMMEDYVIPLAKQDMSSVFREELAQDSAVQSVLHRYHDPLKQWYDQCIFLTMKGGQVRLRTRPRHRPAFLFPLDPSVTVASPPLSSDKAPRGTGGASRPKSHPHLTSSPHLLTSPPHLLTNAHPHQYLG